MYWAGSVFPQALIGSNPGGRKSAYLLEAANAPPVNRRKAGKGAVQGLSVSFIIGLY